MLITCFQCRQQLEVPEDSGGKRVRCLHCEHVIIVPVVFKRADADLGNDAAAAPITALPSMELDEEKKRPANAGLPRSPAVNVPPIYPLPPYDPQAGSAGSSTPPASESPPSASAAPPKEDSPPTMNRGSRRRPLLPVSPPKKPSWLGSIVVGALVGLAVNVILLVVLASTGFFQNGIEVRHAPQRDFFPPQQRQQPQQPQGFNFQPPFNNLLNPIAPKQHAPENFPLWRDYQNIGHRFKVHFPEVPQLNDWVGAVPLSNFRAQHGEWEFSVGHHALSKNKENAIPPEQHFKELIDVLCVRTNGIRHGNNELVVQLKGLYPGREWTITLAGGNPLFVSAYLVQEGDRDHYYLLTARGPNFADRMDEDIVHFFDSFDVLFGTGGGNLNVGQTLFEQMEIVHPVRSRNREFTAMTLDPAQKRYLLGSSMGLVHVIGSNAQHAVATFKAHDSRPIEQICLSADRSWLAVAVAREIQLWEGWDRAVPIRRASIAGLRCAFTADNHLVVVNQNSIKEFDPGTQKYLRTIEVPDHDLAGLVLSPDQRQLAVHGAREILLWQWPEMKLQGRIDAHEALITALAFAPDGKTLASGSADRTIKLWKMETRAERATLRQHAWSVGGLAFQPDGTHLASVGLDGMFLLWDLEPEQPSLVWAQAHQYPLRTLAWDEAGKEVYFTSRQVGTAHQPAGRQSFLRLHRIGRADIKPSAPEAAKMVAQRAGLHLAIGSGQLFMVDNGHMFVTATELHDPQKKPGTIHFWDGDTVQIIHELPASGIGGLSPDGKCLVFSPRDFPNSIEVKELGKGDKLPGMVRFDGDFPQACLFTPDSRFVWIQLRNELVRYELPGLIKKQTLPLKQPDDPQVVVLIPALNQQSFLIERGAGLRRRTFHAMADGKELPLPKRTAEPAPRVADGIGLEFLRIRKSLTSFVELEDLVQGTIQVIGQQRNTMMVSAIHPKRKLAATEDSANNKLLRINFWDLEKRQPILSLPDTSANIANAMGFSPDGRWFVCMTNSGWTRILPVDWILERQKLLPCSPNEVGPP